LSSENDKDLMEMKVFLDEVMEKNSNQMTESIFFEF